MLCDLQQIVNSTQHPSSIIESNRTEPNRTLPHISENEPSSKMKLPSILYSGFAALAFTHVALSQDTIPIASKPSVTFGRFSDGICGLPADTNLVPAQLTLNSGIITTDPGFSSIKISSFSEDDCNLKLFNVGTNQGLSSTLNATAVNRCFATVDSAGEATSWDSYVLQCGGAICGLAGSA